MKQIIILIALLVLIPMESLGDDVETYRALGLLVGSNRAATGQTPLSYAHRDARRMSETLQEVAGFDQSNITVLLDPGKAELNTALEVVENQLAELARRDEKSVFLFYYSGHAKSTGLNLGSEEYALGELKKRLRQMSSTVTLVLLDACQTGAISHVKGVTPATGFSTNSVEQLNVSGMAVIASSSGSELSQESRQLKGSYFSHHFTVGLRGAADVDDNGVVTLAEAYNYAYHRTLTATASTSVGRQHATLEMDLKGKGDMPIAWPGSYRSSLQFPANLEGEILLTHKSSGTVTAEIRKVRGSAYTVALAPGKYDVFLRMPANRAAQCDIEIVADSRGVLNLNGCTELALENQVAKGSDVVYRVAKSEIPRRREYVMGELQLGFFGAGASEFTRKLEDFGYKGQEKSEVFGLSASIVASPLPFLTLGVTVATMDRRTGTSNLTSLEKSVSWSSFRTGGFVRGNLIIGRALFVPYAQVGGGFARANFQLNTENAPGGEVSRDTFNGGYFAGGAGVQMNPLRWFGITLFQLEYTYAGLVRMTGDDLHRKHNNGGMSLFCGVRFGY